MVKEDVLSFIVYILIIGVATVVGIGVVAPIFQGVTQVNGMPTVAFLIIGLIVSIILEISLFEIGHMIGGAIGGYDVVSCNISCFNFYKKYDEDKKKYVWKFRFPKGFDGLSGETMVNPKSEKSKPIMFLLAPLFIYLIQVILMVILFSIIDGKSKQNDLSWLKYLQVLIVCVGGLLFIYNYFPAKLDCATDGYRLTLIGKKENVEAYNELLKIKANDLLGIKTKEFKRFSQVNDFAVKVNLESVAHLLDDDKFEEALSILEEMSDPKAKLSNESITLIKLYKLNIFLMSGDVENGKKLYDGFTDHEKEYLKKQYTLLSVRTAILYYGIVENSEAECEVQIKNIKKAMNKEYKLDLEHEDSLINKTIAVVKERNPKIKVTY